MRKPLASLALAIGALLSAMPTMAAPQLRFTPSSTHIAIGEFVTVDVSISGLDAEILSSVDLNFFFTGAAATNTAGNFGALLAALGTGASGSFDVLTATEVGIVAFSVLDDATLAAQQANSFSLGSFDFQGALDGVTTITLGPDLFFERNFVGLDALSLNVDVGSACIAVGSGVCDFNLPEPASSSLAALALLAAAGAGRSRRRTTTAAA